MPSAQARQQSISISARLKTVRRRKNHATPLGFGFDIEASGLVADLGVGGLAEEVRLSR